MAGGDGAGDTAQEGPLGYTKFAPGLPLSDYRRRGHVSGQGVRSGIEEELTRAWRRGMIVVGVKHAGGAIREKR